MGAKPRGFAGRAVGIVVLGKVLGLPNFTFVNVVVCNVGLLKKEGVGSEDGSPASPRIGAPAGPTV